MEFDGFQSTSLLRGTTILVAAEPERSRYFNPRPSCEGRRKEQAWTAGCGNFNPRPSCEGRLYAVVVLVPCRLISIHVPLARDDAGVSMPGARLQHFNPRPSCEGRLGIVYHLIPSTSISIHVPLARDDHADFRVTRVQPDFNPRPSCEGRHDWFAGKDDPLNFNPRPSCEGRREHHLPHPCGYPISIHVPLARDDGIRSWQMLQNYHFNPRPSCEGRPDTDKPLTVSRDFNPRPSCEGRQGYGLRLAVRERISIHVPLARDDRGGRWAGELSGISIHVPLARDDSSSESMRSAMDGFQSTSLLRGTTIGRLGFLASRFKFQSTSLLRGTTRPRRPHIFFAPYFNPRPSCEGRHDRFCQPVQQRLFQSTSLLRGTTHPLFRRSHFHK